VSSKANSLFEKADRSGRMLGLSLLILGLGMLIMGIATHSLFDRGLGARRDRLYRMHLLRRPVHYHATPTYIVAVALLAVGLLALADIAFRLF
jgi:hypothetical protein